LRSRCDRLASENVELSEKLEKGDSRSGIISSQLQVIRKSDMEAMQEFKKIKAECEQLFEVSEKFIDPRIKQKQFLRI